MPREHRNKNRKLLNCDSFANTIWHCLAPCNEFQNPANFCVWNPESSKVLPEEPESWVWNTTIDGNSESKFHRHRSGIITWNPKGIPCMESRIQDCPGFPYMGRLVFSYMTGAMQTSKLKPKQQNSGSPSIVLPVTKLCPYEPAYCIRFIFCGRANILVLVMLNSGDLYCN